jgi:hypothetical protein
MRDPFRRLAPAPRDDDELREDFGEDHELVVTATHVSQTWTEWGRPRHVAVPLHMISAVAARFHAPLWRLAAGVVVLVGAGALWLKVLTPAFSLRNEWTLGALAATAIGLLALLAYVLGRKQVLTIETPTRRLVVERRGGDDGSLKRIADEIVMRQSALLRRSADIAAPGA